MPCPVPLRLATSLTLALLPACGSGSGEVPVAPALGDTRGLSLEELDGAIREAMDFHRERIDNLQVCLFLGALRRRFGFEEFSDMPARYDGFLEEAPAIPDLRGLRRILFPDNVFPRRYYGDLVKDENKLTIPALYCDRGSLPRGYAGRLREAVELGGYRLTHVGLALIFMDALGCQPPFEDPEGFREDVCRRMAELIRPRDGVSDLELEAAAFLQVLGRGDLVEDEFFRACVVSQLPDGGWANQSPLAGDWHATMMGLWALLELRHGAERKLPLVTSAG